MMTDEQIIKKYAPDAVFDALFAVIDSARTRRFRLTAEARNTIMGRRRRRWGPIVPELFHYQWDADFLTIDASKPGVTPNV